MRFRDDNGLFAVAGPRNAAELVGAGLAASTHRGRASAGVAASDGVTVRCVRGPSPDRLDPVALSELRGSLAVGQTRDAGDDAATGGDLRPFVARIRTGALVVAMSGRLTNGTLLRRGLLDRGRLFTGPSDGETIAALVAESSKATFVNRLVDALWQVEGAYSLVVANEDVLVAVRDPRGFRPLILGSVPDGHVVASDDAGFLAVGASVVREVAPGELLVVERGRLNAVFPFARRPRSACALELPVLTPLVSRAPTWDVAFALGERLGRGAPPRGADVVVALPGAEAAAAGFAAAAALPVLPGVLEERVEPGAPRWRASVGAVAGRRVVVVEVGLGGGSRLAGVAAALRQAGAVEVEARVATPLETRACRYGVSSPVAEELPVVRYPAIEAYAQALGLRSFAALPMDGFVEALQARAGSGFCAACVGGDFPVPPEVGDEQLPLFQGVRPVP